MPHPLRHGLALCLLVATATAATPTAPSAEAFDAAFASALREGMGGTPAEGDAAVAALRGVLPEGDAFRQRRFDAVTCSAPKKARKAALERAGQLLAAELAAPSPDPTNLAMLYSCRAWFRPSALAGGVVIEDLDLAVEQATAAGDPLVIAQMLAARSGSHSHAGDFALALVDSLEAQKVLENADEDFLRAVNLQNVGIAYRRMGEHERADEYLTRSLADPEIEARWVYRFVNLLQLGFLYDESGRRDEARDMLRDAIAICTEQQSHADCGYAQLALAGVEANEGNALAALRALDAAERGFRDSGDEGDPPMVALVRGQALALQRDDRQALTQLDAAIEAWTSDDNARYLTLALPVRADLLERLGEKDRAIADLRRFIAAHAEDDRARAAQRTDFMREQFDASQRELENAELKAREALRIQEIAGLNAAKRWQWVAMALGGVLLLVLLGIVVRQLQKAHRLRLLAMTDPLTGLANRRRTDYRGSEAFKQARLSGQPFCVLAIDIDHFKQVNDTHGHAIGDAVLQRVGRECQRTLRKLDLMGRIGGEEFTGLLPETAEPAACFVAERLRAGVEGLDLDDVVPGLRVTISLGVAQMRDADPDFASVLARADAAMYRAKQSGRNGVVSDETA